MDLISKTKDYIKQITVTGYVVNKSRSKMLLVHHKKLKKWLPAGGHLEQNEIPHEGALREVYEETGIKATLIDEIDNNLKLKGVTDVQIPRPFTLSYQLIPSNSKTEEHIHIDMIFRFEADDKNTVIIQEKEVNEVKWFTKDEIINEIDTFDSIIGFAILQLI